MGRWSAEDVCFFTAMTFPGFAFSWDVFLFAEVPRETWEALLGLAAFTGRTTLRDFCLVTLLCANPLAINIL